MERNHYKQGFFSRSGSKQHCNITKIKSLQAVEDSITALANLINKRKDSISWCVDNLTASANLNKKIPLRDFVYHRPSWHYNSEQFPGISISISKCVYCQVIL